MSVKSIRGIVQFCLAAVLIANCGPSPSTVGYQTPREIRDPEVIGQPYVEQRTETIRHNNCDGANPSIKIERTLMQEQTTIFEVEVEAGGLLRGTPIPEILEAELEARIRAALGRNLATRFQQSVAQELVTEPGTARTHTVTWNETKVKGIIEVIFADGTARLDFERIVGVELANRTSENMPCNGTLLPTPVVKLSPTSKPSPPTSVPPTQPPPTASQVRDYQMISLRELGSPEASNLGLKAGTNTLLGIPFETGWTVTTQCEDRSSLPTTIQLDVAIPQPLNVYLLLQAGWATQQFAGKELGAVSLSFSDGEHIEIPLIVGFNIRDWARNKPEAVSTATSPTLREAWQGTAPDGTTIGGMDVLTIEIPSEYRRSTLASIQIADTSSMTAGSQNPCIHLLAVTVENLR